LSYGFEICPNEIYSYLIIRSAFTSFFAENLVNWVTLDLGVQQGHDTDMLLLTTTHYQMLTLSLNLSTPETEGSSAHFSITSDSLLDLRDRHARPADDGQIVIIDPTSSIICCHLYQGLLKCITVNPSAPRPNENTSASMPRSIASALKASRIVDKTFLDQVSLPIEEVTIMSMVFLHGCHRPTLAVLYQDKKEIRHVKTYEFDLKAKEKVETGWIQSDLSGARTCVAVPAPIGKERPWE